jgi:hypothetical protein
MNSGPENFESLRRLLMIKRHEQAPPGFFEAFPRRVLARIEAGETGDPYRPFWQLPWLADLLAALDRKPAFAAAFSVVVCGLLVAGLVSSVAPAGSSAGPELANGSQSLTALAVPQAPGPAPVFVSSTNGLLPSATSDPFSQPFDGARVIPVSESVISR